ncbi:MAG: hypothetical protein NW701_20325 [Nitrospira sp.]
MSVVRSFCALASLLFLFQGGCTLVWHVSSPGIQANAAAHLPADNGVAYRLAYRASELLEFASEKDVSKFRKNIEAAIQRAGFHVIDERAAGKVLDIHVRQNLPSGGTPQEFVKRLTFGLIPTWTTHEGTFEFAMRLCEKNRMLARARYILSTREFTWILVLPLSWINLFRWDEAYELLGEAVESLLVEGMMKPIQEEFPCMDKPPGAF